MNSLSKAPPLPSGRAIRVGPCPAGGAEHPRCAQAPSPLHYQVIGQDENGLEMRFRGMPLRGVHADDSQNALSLDFQAPVDGAIFDRLPRDLPQWISMAYANFDNGVIRAPAPSPS